MKIRIINRIRGTSGLKLQRPKRFVFCERDVYAHRVLGRVTMAVVEGTGAVVVSKKDGVERIHRVNLLIFEQGIIMRVKRGTPYKEVMELVENKARKPRVPGRLERHFKWEVKRCWENRRHIIKAKRGKVIMIHRSQIYRRGY